MVVAKDSQLACSDNRTSAYYEPTELAACGAIIKTHAYLL